MSDDEDKAAFEQRLSAAERAAKGIGSQKPGSSSPAAMQRSMNIAMRLGVELVAAMMIAVVIGWGLDRLFHSTPWLMVLMVPVGMAAGLRNLVRSAGTKTDV